MTVFPVTGESRARTNSIQLVEKEIHGGNLAVAGNDEISTGVSRRFARTA
jgi:hypothetical protein